MATSGLPSPVPPNHAAMRSPPGSSTIVEAWQDFVGIGSATNSPVWAPRVAARSNGRVIFTVSSTATLIIEAYAAANMIDSSLTFLHASHTYTFPSKRFSVSARRSHLSRSGLHLHARPRNLARPGAFEIAD